VDGATVTETDGTIVAVAVPDFVGSATEVAVTDTWGGLGTADGAVYSPPDEIVPQAAPLQPLPTRLHDTAVSVVPVTVAVNCFCFPEGTCAVDGETLTATGGATVIRAEPDTEGSATEIAEMVTWGEGGTFEGAVYRPFAVRVPHDDVPQLAPVICHVTPVMVVPLTLATNCCRRPTDTVACAGDTVTATSEVEPRITEALAEAVRSASDVAVTVTTFDVGVVAGAVYNPLLLIWPQVLPLQEAPVKLQTTTLLVVPLTVAVNCALPPACTCTTLGLSETETDAQVKAGQTNATRKIQANFKSRLILASQ
jgi:hypothetical protein